MQIKREQLNPTTVKLVIAADPAALDEAKQTALRQLARTMKLSGFRPGKAPLSLVERNADPAALQTEVLDNALNRLYGAALDKERLRPVDQPAISLTKFVPFTTLEFTAEVQVIGEVRLPDYKKLQVAKKPATVTDKDVDEVIKALRTRAAEKSPVARAAQNGDEVVIDFFGKDAQTNEPVNGAEGKGYPLLLGSDTFIPGFETNLIGLLADAKKSFTLAFPKDYGVKALQNRKVTFDVTVTEVREVTEPALDDEFAATVGPVKTVSELKSDINKQLLSEKQAEADRAYQNELVEKLAAGTTAAIPDVLIDEEVTRAEQDLRQNLSYRGQTFEAYLEEQGKDEAAYRAELRGPATERVKAGLALSEVAEQEGLRVTPEELSRRIQLLKGRYSDKAMQAELDKPASARSIASAILTEKTIAKLVEYASAAGKKPLSPKE